ncbi:Major Facilitator Superfamily (MFS), partial [Pseudoloma neurophilia]
KSILIAIFVHIAQQASCINAVITYSNGILDKNSDGSSAQQRTFCIGLFSLVVTCGASFIIESVGRKVLLQLSIAIVIASLWMLIKKYSAFSALLLFQFGFSFGLGPITWLLTNEIFPVEYQAIAAPLCSTINWFLATITVLFFEDWLHKYGMHILYGNISCLFIIACALQILLAETRGQDAKFQ